VIGQESIKHTFTKQAKPGKGRTNHGFSIDGLDELIKDFAALGEDAIYKLSEPSVEAANVVLAKARQNTHDITGELDRALKVTKPGKKKGKAYRIFAKVGFTKKGMHGVPLELGHRLYFMGHKTNSDVAPRPFLRPAADESKDEVANIIAAAMNEALDKFGGLK